MARSRNMIERMDDWHEKTFDAESRLPVSPQENDQRAIGKPLEEI